MIGVHAELEVGGVTGCPVAPMSEDFEVESVVTDRQAASRGGSVVGEVTVRRAEDDPPVPEEAERVFGDDSRSVFRFTAAGEDCPCGRVPDHGCPVRSIDADGRTVAVSFVAPDVETVRRVVSDLRARCDTVGVRRLVRSDPEGGDSLVLVDRSAFTDRQYEVLSTAHEMGYFERPKEADSADVASALGVSVSTFTEHLAVAQSKLLNQILGV
ncbi:helix-turn-helix domain-containing protein [Halopelagius fulvigenes]|uniref:Helix-turn-helix domain-containing protein n=1 Tax=Halopelagius fulvigenes TaxID=1198324 RepID=A0ABD5U7N0_9EURY